MPLAPFAGTEELSDTLQRPVARDAALLALRRASGAIRAHCGWSVSSTQITEHVVNQTTYSRHFWLPTLWLTSVDRVSESDNILTAHTEYEWDVTGKVWRGNGWWTVYAGELVVDFTHGYPDEDDRLEAAHDVCLAAAARIYANPLNRWSEQTGNESWQARVAPGGQTLTDGEMAQLNAYTLDHL